MDDRYNICDVCGKDIIETMWNDEKRKTLKTGQKQIDTPSSVIPLRDFGDNVIHKDCLKTMIENQLSSGI